MSFATVYGEPFSICGLLNLPELPEERPSSSGHFGLGPDFLDSGSILIESKTVPLSDLKTDFFFLDSHDFHLPDLLPYDDSTQVSENEDSYGSNVQEKERREDSEDVWTLPDVTRPYHAAQLLSWDIFLNPAHVEPQPVYLSEAGPAALDAALAIDSGVYGNRSLPKFVRPSILIHCLFELGLGRDSILFHYDHHTSVFKWDAEELGISGISREVQEGIVQEMLEAGSHGRNLMAFIDEKSTNASSSSVSIAFASALSTIILVLRHGLERTRADSKTLLHLQQSFSKPRILLNSLYRMVDVFESGSSQGEIVNILLSDTEHTAYEFPWLEIMLHEMVARTAQPLLQKIGWSIGFEQASDHVLEWTSCPTDAFTKSSYSQPAALRILPPTLSQLVCESRNSLQILIAHQPEHPILSPPYRSTSPTSLSWEYSWEAIEAIQSRAREYESSLRDAILVCNRGSVTSYSNDNSRNMEVLSPGKDSDIFEGERKLQDLDEHCRLNKHLGNESILESDRLYRLADEALLSNANHSSLSPSLSEALSLSITPLLSAQSRLLSFSVLHLLFKTHCLRAHLELLHSFQLFGDGDFASRLSRALFDSMQSNIEGRRKAGGNAGLRLQTRNSWPPASSELRLVLIGILSESSVFQPSNKLLAHRGQVGVVHDLSETLSFAIRDLSDTNVEKCRDAHSLHALDFLRLQYKPTSSILEAVINTAILRKYDKIFKHLLRLLRVNSVSQTLLRDVACRGRKSAKAEKKRMDHRFRIELEHFVCTVSDYSANIAIGLPSTRLLNLVGQVEECLQRQDFDGVISSGQSPAYLKSVHEEALNDMIGALFLDDAQVQAKAVLEDILGIVLKFAAQLGSSNEHNNDMVQRMHEDFQHLVARFIRHLRTLAENAADSANDSAGHSSGKPNTFEYLLVRLDLFGYYAQVKAR